MLYDVDRPVDGDETSIDGMLAQLAELAYDVQPIIADASAYGFPHSFLRRVLVGVLAPGRRARILSYDAFFQTHNGAAPRVRHDPAPPWRLCVGSY